MTDKLYTLKEVAKILQVRPNTVKKFCLTQQLSFMIVGKQYRISEEQLQEYYRANTIQRKEVKE